MVVVVAAAVLVVIVVVVVVVTSVVVVVVKGKTISVEAWAGSEGLRKLRPPDFKTIET